MSHLAERRRERRLRKVAEEAEEAAKHPLRQKTLGFAFSDTHVKVMRKPYKEEVVEKPNYITECVVCHRRNKMAASRCHFCRVGNPIMSGVVTMESVAARAEDHHIASVRALVDGMAKDELFGWIDRAQLVIQGVRLAHVAHMYERFRYIFNQENKVELLERPTRELIALLPSEVFEQDDFTLHVVHSAIHAFLDLESVEAAHQTAEGGQGNSHRSEAYFNDDGLDDALDGQDAPPKGSLNVYDTFGGIAIFCSQDPLVERFKFLCSLFAFDDGEDEVSEDEFSVMMSSVARAMARLQLLDGVQDEEIDAICGEAFLDENGQSRLTIGAEDIVELAKTHDVLRDLVRTIEFFPRLLTLAKSLLKRQEVLVESIAEGERKAAVAAAARATIPATERAPVSHGHRGECNVILGPLIGSVTSRSAAVMLEVDRTAIISCEVYAIAPGDVSLLPSPPSAAERVEAENALTQQKSLQWLVQQHFDRMVPGVFLLPNLRPSTIYELVFSHGKTRIGARARVVTQAEHNGSGAAVESPPISLSGMAVDQPSEPPTRLAAPSVPQFVVVGEHSLVGDGNNLAGKCSDGVAPRYDSGALDVLMTLANQAGASVSLGGGDTYFQANESNPQVAVEVNASNGGRKEIPIRTNAVKFCAPPFDVEGAIEEAVTLVNGNDLLARGFIRDMTKAQAAAASMSTAASADSTVIVDKHSSVLVPESSFETTSKNKADDEAALKDRLVSVAMHTPLGLALRDIFLKRLRLELGPKSPIGRLAQQTSLEFLGYKYAVRNRIAGLELPAFGSGAAANMLLGCVCDVAIAVFDMYLGSLREHGSLAEPHTSRVVIDPANPALVRRVSRRRKQREIPWTSPLVGRRVAVRFEDGRRYYATIKQYDHNHTEQVYDEVLHKKVPSIKPYFAVYDDGEVEWLSVSDADVTVLSDNVSAMLIQKAARHRLASRHVQYAKTYKQSSGWQIHCATRLQRWLRRHSALRMQRVVQSFGQGETGTVNTNDLRVKLHQPRIVALQAAVRGHRVRVDQRAERKMESVTRIQAWVRGVRSRVRTGVHFRISGAVGRSYGQTDKMQLGKSGKQVTQFDRQVVQLKAFRRALDRSLSPPFRRAFSAEFCDGSLRTVTLKVDALALAELAAGDAARATLTAAAAAAAERAAEADAAAEVANNAVNSAHQTKAGSSNIDSPAGETQRSRPRVALPPLPPEKLRDSDWGCLQAALHALSTRDPRELCRLIVVSEIPFVCPDIEKMEEELLLVCGRSAVGQLNAETPQGLPTSFFLKRVTVPMLDVLFGWQKTGRRQERRSTTAQTVVRTTNLRRVFLVSSWRHLRCAVSMKVFYTRQSDLSRGHGASQKLAPGGQGFEATDRDEIDADDNCIRGFLCGPAAGRSQGLLELQHTHVPVNDYLKTTFSLSEPHRGPGVAQLSVRQPESLMWDARVEKNIRPTSTTSSQQAEKAAALTKPPAATGVGAPTKGSPFEVERCDEASMQPRVELGPIIGRVTPHAAVILLQTDRAGSITAVLYDILSGNTAARTHCLSSHRPQAFLFTQLRPGRQYLLSVSGCTNASECVGRVSTPFHTVTTLSIVAIASNLGCGRMMQDTNNLLVRLRKRCRSAPWNRPLKLRPEHEPPEGSDIVLHIGGQVSFLRTAMMEATSLLDSYRNCKLSLAEETRIRESIFESLRRAYVHTWGAPHLRWILANAPNLMLWGFSDLGGDSVCGAHPGSGPQADPMVVQMAMELYFEYQRQLWDPQGSAEVMRSGYGRSSAYDKARQPHESSFHRYGELGILSLDTVSVAQVHGNNFKNGQFAPTLPHQETPSLLSVAQWSMIEATLEPQVGIAETAAGRVSARAPFHVLIVTSPLLILSDVPDAATYKSLGGASTVQATPVQMPGGGGRHGQSVQMPMTWAQFPADQARLLDLVFRWLEASPFRSAAFVCDGSYIGGLQSEVQLNPRDPSKRHGATTAMNKESKQRMIVPRSVVQVAVGPLTDGGDPLVSACSPTNSNSLRMDELRRQRAEALLVDSLRYPGGWVPLCDGRYRFRHKIANGDSAGRSALVKCTAPQVRPDVPKVGSSSFGYWAPNFATLRVVYDPRAMRMAAELMAEQQYISRRVGAAQQMQFPSTISTSIIAATHARASIIVGPVIGLTTHNSTIVLVEIDNDWPVSVLLTDEHSGAEFLQTLQLRAQRPRGFHFIGLKPQHEYRVNVVGVMNGDDPVRCGRVCTPPERPPRLRLACVSNDEPSASSAHWWDRLYDNYIDRDNRVDNGVDMVLHCGGQVLTGQCFSQRDVAALARGGQLSSVQDAGLLRAAEDRLRDQAREMYRACWNIPSRRRVLAHLPSLMIWGPQEVFHSDNETVKRLHRPEDVGSEHKENNGADNTSKTSDIINRVCRDVYWEYQRQLWAPGFAGKGGTDEFHFHRYGRVGLLFIDILGFRLGPRGRNDMTRAVVGPRQLRFLNEAVLADATLMTLVVVAPCAPKMLPAALIQPMMQWRNRPPVPSPKDFARQLLFVGGGRRARQARVGMFVSTPPAEVSPPDVLSEASQKRDQHLGGTAFMLSTGSVAGRPGEISFGVIHAHANLHSSWIERWVEPARSEQAKGVVTVGPVVGSLSSTAAVVLFEADKSAPSARVVLIDVVAGTQHTSSASALEANRPKSFRVQGLKPGRRYIVYLEGVVCPKDRRAFVTTPPADPEELSIIAVAGDRAHELQAGEEDHWHTLSSIMDSPGALPTVILHLGGQVTMTHAFHITRHWLEHQLRGLAKRFPPPANGADENAHAPMTKKLLQPNDVVLPLDNTEVDHAISNIEAIARERLREEYRESWNLPSKRYTLARCSSMMVMGALDLCRGYDGIFAAEELGVEPPPETTRMLRLAQQVFQEYQWQLSDPDYASKLKKGTNEFVQFQRVGYIGVLTLDCRGNRLRRDGTRADGKPVLGTAQWKFLENVLRGDAAETVFLAVGIEQPPALMSGDKLLTTSLARPGDPDANDNDTVGLESKSHSGPTRSGASDVHAANSRDQPADVEGRRLYLQSHWGMKEDDLVRLLEALFEWEGQMPQRKVVLLCGGVGFGLNSTISAGGKAKIPQITVGPITDKIDRIGHSMSGRIGRFTYNHNRLTRETRSKRTIAIVRAVVRNEVGYQEKLRQQAADIEAKEAAAAETGAEVQYDEPKFVTSIRDQMLAQSVPFQVAVKKQHRVTVTKNVQVTTDFVSAVHEVLQVQAANLRAELSMAQVDEVIPAPIPFDGPDDKDANGRLGNEYAQWWARTGALSRCPILPHPTMDWSDELRKKAKRSINRFSLDFTLRPFQEALAELYNRFRTGGLDFAEAVVAVWQRCDAKMRASMAHLPDPMVQRYCIERLQAPTLDPPLDYDTFSGYMEGVIGNAICMKVAFEMDEEAEVQIAASIEAFETAKVDHQVRMAEREQKLKERTEKKAKKRRDHERKAKLREELQESLSRQI